MKIKFREDLSGYCYHAQRLKEKPSPTKPKPEKNNTKMHRQLDYDMFIYKLDLK